MLLTFLFLLFLSHHSEKKKSNHSLGLERCINTADIKVIEVKTQDVSCHINTVKGVCSER